MMVWKGSHARSPLSERLGAQPLSMGRARFGRVVTVITRLKRHPDVGAGGRESRSQQARPSIVFLNPMNAVN